MNMDVKKKKHRSYTGRPTRSESEQLLQQIMDSASRTFLEKGFQGASMEGIAALSGVSKRTIYRHFESKSVLFLAVIEQYAVNYVSELEQVIKTRKQPAEALFEIGLFIANKWFHPDNMRFCRIIIAEMHRIEGLSELIDPLLAASRRPVEQYLSHLLEQNIIVCDDVHKVTIQFVQLAVNGHYYFLRNDSVIPDAEARMQLVKSAVSLILRGYSPELQSNQS